LKLNILIICIILALSAGLMMITYDIYCRKVDSIYYKQTELAAKAAAQAVSTNELMNLWKYVNTEEYRQLHQQAVEANDEELIRQWLLSKPGINAEYADQVEVDENDPNYETLMKSFTLYSDYDQLCFSMETILNLFDIKDSYIQYDQDGVTYNLVDPTEGLLHIGSVEESIPEFAGYEDNADIPATVYCFHDDWLCTACHTIHALWTDEVIGQVGVDIDMNDVVAEKHWFLMNSILFIILLTVAAIIITVLILRRIATRPLRMLAQASRGFAGGEGTCTKEDVIELPIRSGDEIGELYDEIRSMQNRIVDYMDHLTAITAEKERANTELRMAAAIQESALPNRFPAFPERHDFRLFASMDPAKAVGGDFYDFFLIDDSHLCLLIADVSDKGIPAALFMMSAKNLISYRARTGGTPGEILSDVNRHICKSGKTRMFVTVWMGILDTDTGVMTCTNAGHEFPAIRGTDGVFRFFKDVHGFVVGGLARAKYKDYELILNPGDAIFAYTDGVPEAINPAEEFYGSERLLAALNRYAGEDPEGILRGIRADVDAFTNGADQFDDLTMLCLEYRPSKIS